MKSIQALFRRAAPLTVVLLALAGMRAILFVSVPPGNQEFPLDDDWCYTKGLLAFAHGEGIHYYHWPSMPQLGQWLWGLAFIRTLGESFVVLRLSTFLLSLFGIGAFYDLLRRETGLQPWPAAFSAAMLGLNPLFFMLAGTYMTDVPSLSFSLIALALYARALKDGRLTILAGAVVVAVLAVCTRQNTVAAPLAAGFLLWRQAHLRWHPLWLLGILFPLGLGVAVHLWFGSRSDTIGFGLDPTHPHLRLYWGIHLLGLSSLPLLLLKPIQGSWKCFGLVALTFLTVAGITAFHPNSADYGGLFPYAENLITPWGTLAPYVIGGDRPVMMNSVVRLGLTAAGCLGAAGLVTRLFHNWRIRGRAGLLGIFSVLQLLILAVSPTFFDRYLIVFMPGVFSLASATASPRTRWMPAMVVLLLFSFFSVALSHDWLAWNSARWELGRKALAQGIAARDIEGGFEWDGWYSPEAALPSRFPVPPRGLMLPWTRRFFPEISGHYALTFSEMPGSIPLETIPYRQWLIPGMHRFFLVEEKVTTQP